MQENSGLGNVGLPQFLVGAAKHNVCYFKSEQVVSLFKQSAGVGVYFVQILAHTGKLRALAREDICFHLIGFKVER